MVSIKEVAGHAGVSISTVSKVLNDYPNISEETRKRVKASITQLHYVPNTVASALSSKQSGRAALLINLNAQTQVVDEIDMQYLAGAIRQAGELGMDVITVFFSMIRDKKLSEILNYFKSQNIEGIIIYGMSGKDTILKELVESGEFKIVLIDVPIVNETTTAVRIDQEQAQYEVARKTILENKGPSDKVLYIYGKKDAYVTEERIAGMQRLQEELNFTLFMEEGNFSEKQARNITFRYADSIDIIVCASDLMAIGAMKALTERDVFHPVCGFDGITLMAYAGKQMNTVCQNFARISAEAVRELGRLMNGEPGRMKVLPHKVTRLQYLDMIC